MSRIYATALIGAQYGSEGKGMVAEKIADQYDVHIRTGGPNAGHTFYFDGTDGRHKHVARTIPVGWVNPEAYLILGPGALVDADLLVEEVQQIEDYGVPIRHRLLVDERAMLIDPVRHHQGEGGIYGEPHRQIGSTGEGVGLARMARISRGVMGDRAWSKIDRTCDDGFFDHHGIKLCDTVEWLNKSNYRRTVLLEGTQGSALSLIHGHWPFVTSNDTNAAQLCVDAGISPHSLEATILVARSHPIRVAGNSGPMENEISWEELGVDPEITTVTKKQRRIGGWSDELIRRALWLNGPSRMVITFADYMNPRAAGITEWAGLPQSIREFAMTVEREFSEVMVVGFGTGPDTLAWHPGSVHSKWRK